MFSGSLRSNLDPLEQYDDVDIWNALEHANLTAIIRDKCPQGLQYDVGNEFRSISVYFRSKMEDFGLD